MRSYELNVDLEPTDKYEKAKKDLLQALKSFHDLSLQERERLMQELIGTTNMAVMCNMIKMCFDR